MRTLVAPLLCCLCFSATAQVNDDLAWNDPNAEGTQLVQTSEVPRVMPSEALPFQFVLVYDERGKNVMSTGAAGITMEDLDQLDPGNYLVVAMDDHGLEVDREELAILRY